MGGICTPGAIAADGAKMSLEGPTWHMTIRGHKGFNSLALLRSEAAYRSLPEGRAAEMML